MPANKESDRSRLTKEALSDVDDGRVISHQSVLEWANSLGADEPSLAPDGGDVGRDQETRTRKSNPV